MKNKSDRYDKLKRCNFLNNSDIEKLRNARVLIFGAGGVGTNLVQNIAASGIGHIGLIDNDIIEPRNLSIQILYNEEVIGRYKVDVCKEWVNKYDSSIDIKTYNLRLDENNWQDIVKDYDILLDAFDTSKSVTLINKISVLTEKPLVHAGTINDIGTIWTTIPKKTPCLQCMDDYEDSLKVPDDYPYGVLQSVGAIIASLQTFEAIKLILNKGVLIAKSITVLHGMIGLIKRRKLYYSKTNICPICGQPRASLTPFKE